MAKGSSDVDEVGRRVAAARQAARLTQEQLGIALGLDKTQISKIESGQRRLDISEVALAAERLGTSVRALLGMSERTKLALAARLAEGASDGALRSAMNRARQIIEVDDVLTEVASLTAPRADAAIDELRSYGKEVAQRSTRSWKAAQRDGGDLAEETRRVLDLGSDALGDLPDLIEACFGVDVALSRLGNVADGLCVHTNGVCLILASSDFSLGHVRFTLAHELGHHLFGDPREIIGESSKEMFAKSVPEWRANAFAANFLMPERGVRRLLELRGETTSVSLLGVGAVMQHFQTSKQATCYRLENLGLLASGAVDSFSNVPARDLIDAVQASSSDSSVSEQLEVIRPPTRLLRTALDAFAHKQIGLGPVATLLERPDDDELFAELLADSQVAAVYDTASRGRELEV